MSLNNANGHQVHFFHTNGFVVHKIAGNFKGTCTAWYDAAGRVIDVEHSPQGFGGKSRKVKTYGPIWQNCERWGNVYRVKGLVEV